MRIVGHGIDLVDVDRIERMLADHAERMLERIYTPGEQAECAGDARSAARFAARFAAKEAALKALGTGLADGIKWTDVSVATDERGAPRLIVDGRARELARERLITHWTVSLSHTRTHAMASVIAMSTDPLGFG